MKPWTRPDDRVRRVIAQIAGEHGVPLDRVMGRCRLARVSYARHHAMAVIRWSSGLSFPEIGRYFGRDHTTVIAGVRRYERELNGG